MNAVKRSVAAVVLAGGLALGTAAAPASAQPVITGGLVNVTITNTNVSLLNNNNINVGIAAALNLAANVCGNSVPISVLGTSLAQTGTATCTNTISGTGVVLRQIAG